MRLLQTLGRRASWLPMLLTLWMMAGPLRAQTLPGRAEVRAIKGQAFVSVGAAPARPLKVGTVLLTGATIRTGPDSLVDLFLGNSAGVLRITENSTLVLDRLTLIETGLDRVVEVQLNLPEGQILGNVNKLSGASKYEIKVPNGVAGIRGTRFRFGAKGDVVLLDGALIFVHVGPGGNPVPYTMTAPPAVMFSPSTGVQLATPAVIQEVTGQMGRPQRSAPPSKTARNFDNPQPEPEVIVSPVTGQ
ncbi:MAG TPA: FecR domain-containing protein [Methylomirabilota bacterium]|nr:FecR domain-containing protein [Methylomirabilota bacterium]